MTQQLLIDRIIAVAIWSWYVVLDRARLASERRSKGTYSSDRVSIPIATYDRIDILIERTIPALLAQTHCDIEIIVVGDGTPAHLWAKLRKAFGGRVQFARLPSRTRYPKDPLALWMVAGWKARNLGARIATGEWIFWMSDDDIIPREAIETMLNVVRADPRVQLVSGTKQAGTISPRLIGLENANHGLRYPVVGMPLLCHATLRSFRWSSQSYRKAWNRPSDLDLLDRMGRAGIQMAVTPGLVAIHPEVPGTRFVGSRGAIVEELGRRKRSARFIQ